jgi:gliding motility-associated-like protein
MGVVSQPSCTPTEIIFNLTTPVFCNSIAANGSDFIITGPSAVVVTGAAAITCDGTGKTNSVRIQLSTPILASGTYTLAMTNGSDGNTLLGDCGSTIAPATTTTFTLDAAPSLAMGTLPTQLCAPATLVLTFADSIICNSIAPDGSDFTITGPSAVTIASAIGTCSPNNRTKVITITLSNPINVSGSYQLTLNNGSDGNPLIGNCNSQVNAGENVSFEIPVSPPGLLSTIDAVTCSPTSVRINLNSPVLCNSISPNGSDFIITGPSAVTISSAAGVCDANGFATSINLQLSSPIVVGGTYDVQLVAGSDGNTLLNECLRETPLSGLTFTATDTVSAEFTYTIQYSCEFNQVDFVNNGGNGINQWTWTVNGVPAGNTGTISQSFSAASNNQIELTVSNGTCSDTFTENIVHDNKVVIEFEVPESICPGDSVIFINNSTGLIDTWEWNFGNGNTSTSQHPLWQIYPTTGVESFYTVSLTGGNADGCEVTTTETIKVLSTCIIAVPTAFTPNNDGLNDFLFPLNAHKAENLDFKVFNRWGQLVFHSKNWSQKWDGRINGVDQATGVYVWSLNYVDRDTREAFSVKGTTVLIR